MNVGIDIVENKRIEKLLKSYGDRFLEKFLNANEVYQWKKGGKKMNTLCGLFAAKEAIFKAVNCKITFLQIEINHDDDGVPTASIISKNIRVIISISHEIKYSAAVAICN